MASQSILALDKTLLVLLEPSTSPEKALQLLSTSFFAPEAYSKEHNEPVVIFLAYIKFVLNKQPSGSVLIVEGIWEEILKKSFKYLMIKYEYMNCFAEQFKANYPPNICAWLVPALGYKIGAWVVKILGHHNRCPNPYVRLEIFRLNLTLRFSVTEYSQEDRESLCETFWYTMCEVNPHCFYPSGDGYDPMFNASDMERMLGDVLAYMSYEHINDLNFVSKVLQLTGVFATRIRDDPVHYEDLSRCIGIINLLLDNQFTMDQVTCQSIRPYVLETVCEITTTAIFSKGRETDQVDSLLIFRRDNLVGNFDLSSKPFNLPRLLLMRQVQGSSQVRQHAMLLGDLYPSLIKCWTDGYYKFTWR